MLPLFYREESTLHPIGRRGGSVVMFKEWEPCRYTNDVRGAESGCQQALSAVAKSGDIRKRISIPRMTNTNSSINPDHGIEPEISPLIFMVDWIYIVFISSVEWSTDKPCTTSFR